MKFNIKKNGIYSFAFATAVSESRHPGECAHKYGGIQSNASKVLLGSLS